jgi:uncharacterized membrane protein YgcG
MSASGFSSLSPLALPTPAPKGPVNDEGSPPPVHRPARHTRAHTPLSETLAATIDAAVNDGANGANGADAHGAHGADAHGAVSPAAATPTVTTTSDTVTKPAPPLHRITLKRTQTIRGPIAAARSLHLGDDPDPDAAIAAAAAAPAGNTTPKTTERQLWRRAQLAKLRTRRGGLMKEAEDLTMKILILQTEEYNDGFNKEEEDMGGGAAAAGGGGGAFGGGGASRAAGGGGPSRAARDAARAQFFRRNGVEDPAKRTPKRAPETTARLTLHELQRLRASPMAPRKKMRPSRVGAGVSPAALFNAANDDDDEQEEEEEDFPVTQAAEEDETSDGGSGGGGGGGGGGARMRTPSPEY